jgi:hypothetical protein
MQTTGVRFQTGTRDFSLPCNVFTGYGAHPDSHPMGTEGYIPGGKATGA